MQTSTNSNQERESEEMTEQEPTSSATIKADTNDATDPESLDAATGSDERGDRNPFLTGSVILSELANKPLPQTNYLIERLGIAPGRPTLLVRIRRKVPPARSCGGGTAVHARGAQAEATAVAGLAGAGAVRAAFHSAGASARRSSRAKTPRARRGSTSAKYSIGLIPSR